MHRLNLLKYNINSLIIQKNWFKSIKTWIMSKNIRFMIDIRMTWKYNHNCV